METAGSSNSSASSKSEQSLSTDWVWVNDASQKPYDYKFKILVMGAGRNSGKSSLIRQFVSKKFQPNARKPKMATYDKKIVRQYGKCFKLKIWNLSSRKNDRIYNRLYCDNVNGVLFVLDLSQNWSKIEQKMTDGLVEFLTNSTARKPNNIPKILVGNKMDKSLAECSESAKNFAHKNRMIYIETCAMDGTGINSAFSILIQSMLADCTLTEFSSIADPTSPKLTVKLIVFGERNSGKTSIIERFVDGRFNDISWTRKLYFTAVKRCEKFDVQLQIWDAPKDANPTDNYNFYRNADAALFIIDLQQHQFSTALLSEIKDVQDRCETPIPTLILGAKCEDVGAQKVNRLWIQSFASEQKLQYLPTSAKSDLFVNEAFDLAVETAVKEKIHSTSCVIS